MKNPIRETCEFLFYTYIGYTFASAVKESNVTLLKLAIAVMAIGMLWIFPLFLPEEKRDR